MAAREEIFRTILEGLWTGLEEPEGIGQPTDHIERETDSERINSPALEGVNNGWCVMACTLSTD